MADDSWSADAVKAINVSVCRAGPTAIESVDSFNPEFTEQFFGQEQVIFGYRNLNISLRFAAHDLYPNVAITYDKKFPPLGQTTATDIEQVLAEYLPSYAFDDAAKFEGHVKTPAPDFKPPGKLEKSYEVEGRTYEIWAAELSDPAVQTLIERFQILVPMFIDGGIILDVHDKKWTLDRWRVFFIYEKLSEPPASAVSPYSIVGYATAYRFLTYQLATSSSFAQASDADFPPASPMPVSSLPNKSRISQLLILPGQRGAGHGARLYNALLAAFREDPVCVEVTVEDPNERFDDLRDVCDYAYLQGVSREFASLVLNASDPALQAPGLRRRRLPTALLMGCTRAQLKALRLKHKLAPRQFARLVELRLLAGIPLATRRAGTARLSRKFAAADAGDRAYYAWRLLVKQRIYRLHRDVLVQLDLEQRIEKLEEALETQARDYERLLEKIEKHEKKDVGTAEGAKTEERVAMVRRGKRKVVDEEDEEAGEAERVQTKKVKENGTVAADGAVEDARGEKRPSDAVA